MAFTTGLNNYNTTKWLVNPVAGLGTHTTIATALTSASSGDDIYIMPGTYTENLTLKAGVNLIAYITDSTNATVVINGKCSASFSGTCNISGIELRTNSNFFLELTGANSTKIYLSNCTLNSLNNTGISSTGSDTSSAVNIYDCIGFLQTTGIANFAFTNGSLRVYDTQFNNSGGSSTANTFSGLNLYYKNCLLSNPTTTSGSTAIFISNHNFYDIASVNATAINSNSTSASFSTTSFCDFIGTGSATAITVGAGSTMLCTECNIASTNAASVSGSGSFTYGLLTQSLTKGTISPTTVVSLGTIGNLAGSSPPVGYIGEKITASATNVSMTTSVAKNITSASFTPGIWMVFGCVVSKSTTSTTYMASGINITTATFTTVGLDYSQINGIAGATTPITLNVPIQIIPITATTTYYLNAITQGAGTLTADGYMYAVRIA